MPKYRADFDVTGTSVLPNDAPPLRLQGDDPDFEIIISNKPAYASGHSTGLDVRIIMAAENIKEVPTKFRNFLAKQLDVLTFVTQSTFKIEQCNRVVEWEPFQKSRLIRIIQEFDPLHPPSPDLPSGCIRTVEIISKAKPDDYIHHALHCFRNGVRAEQLGDQFQYFWLAIETIAEGRKDKTKIPIKCPRCEGPLTCNNCQEVPLRGPLSGQAIRNLINITVQPDADRIYRDLSEVRNRLMHGGRSASAAIKKTGKTLDELVNLAGNIAWHAIFAALPELDGSVEFGHRDGIFARGRFVVGVDGVFDFKGQTEQPSESEIPSGVIEAETRFREENGEN